MAAVPRSRILSCSRVRTEVMDVEWQIGLADRFFVDYIKCATAEEKNQ